MAVRRERSDGFLQMAALVALVLIDRMEQLNLWLKERAYLNLRFPNYFLYNFSFSK